MEYQTRKYPQFAACGLNCGLCPRYYTVGSSRCPGCAGKGFLEVHPTCGILSCCQRKGLEYCFECGEFPCMKYDRQYVVTSNLQNVDLPVYLSHNKGNRITTYKRRSLQGQVQVLGG